MAKTGKGDFAEAKITESAKELFYEQGFNKTTVAQITKNAGVNNGLFTYYFGSKSNLAGMIETRFRLDMRNLVSAAMYDRYGEYNLALGIATEYRVIIDLHERYPKLRRFVMENYVSTQQFGDISDRDTEQSRDSMPASQRAHFYQMQKRLINPSISDVDLAIYQAVGISAANSLVTAWHNGIIDCSKEYLGDKFIQICFWLLGLEDERIEQLKRDSLDAMEGIHLVLKPYFILELE
ncbi:MAG: TetR/AcrR family transcriptional regulator [Eubacteriaceae bacterium]|nr:TetR/AcrR family transcriptional regulator [Eubacteriaceae bacterium]